MKKIVVLFSIFVVLFSIANLKAQTNWIDFGNNGEYNQLPDINMISSSNYIIDFYGVNNYRKIINDTAYDMMSLPGNYGKTIDIGFPQLPVLTYYIEVTSDTPLITINSSTFNILQNFNLIPAQESETIGEWDTIPPFTKNDSVYNLNQFYPSANVKVSLPSVCRGHKIATIVVYPIQFNPVTKQIKVVQNIDFTVHNAGSIESDKDNIIFDNFLKSNVINYVPNSKPDYNIDLLILTPDIFYESLLPLKEWKEKSGIRTRIVTQTEVINAGYLWLADENPDNVYDWIDGFIKNAYTNWGSLAPEYLLLIGESELLPTHYWFNYPTVGYVASDVYYTTMDISNFSSYYGVLDFADIFGGRISVDNTSELDVIINKIIEYEVSPFLGNSNT